MEYHTLATRLNHAFNRHKESTASESEPNFRRIIRQTPSNQIVASNKMKSAVPIQFIRRTYHVLNGIYLIRHMNNTPSERGLLISY